MSELSKHAEAVVIAFDIGYRVNEAGQVVSHRGTVRAVYHAPGKPYGEFSIAHARKTRRVSVHKLAAFQKFGEAALQRGVHVRHLDGNARNNATQNLAIGSASENNRDKDKAVRVRAARAGAATRSGIRARQSLTREQALELVQLSSLGWTTKALCERFGVCRLVVYNIRTGRSYAHETGIQKHHLRGKQC